MINVFKDIFAGVILIIISVIMYIESSSIPKKADFSIGSGFVPQIVALSIFLFSLWLIISACRTAFLNRKTEKHFRLNHIIKWETSPVVLKTLVLISLYITCLNYLGFIISTFLFLFLQFHVLAPQKEKKLLLFLLLAALISCSIYYIFSHMLSLVLPSSIFI